MFKIQNLNSTVLTDSIEGWQKAIDIPHHRHWLSHSVFVGTIYRLLWLLFPVAIVLFSPIQAAFVQLEPEQLTRIVSLTASLYAGIELSAAIHLWVDSFPSK